MIALIINIPDSVERLKLITTQCKNKKIPHIVVEGVVGNNLYKPDYRYRQGLELGILEEKLRPTYFMDKKNFQCYSKVQDKIMPKVGCFLSHIKAVRLAYTLKLKSVLILEDDIKFDDQLLEQLKKYEGIERDIVYVGGHSKELPEKICGTEINCNDFKLYGTYGYYLPSQKAIKKLLQAFQGSFKPGKKKLKIRNPSGDIRMLMAIDKYYMKFFHSNCICIYPPLVVHNEDLDSTIDNSKKYKKRYGNKCISKLSYNMGKSKESTLSGSIGDPQENITLLVE